MAKRQDDRAARSDPSTVIVCTGGAELRRRIATTLEEQDLPVWDQVVDVATVAALEIDAAAVIVLACDVDEARDMAALRRLRREASQVALVVISPPANGTGVRRALDAGADALVFDPELELTLAPTVRAVAIGQSVVPREFRASVERPILSHRENQVLALVRNGLTNAQIAERLFLAESTVKSHLSSIFTKFGVRSRKEVAAFVDSEPAPDTAIALAGGADRPGRATA